MSDAHGHHDAHGAHAHAHEAPAEDPLVTPGWVSMLGLGLFVAGALGVYLFLAPGVLNRTASAAGDAAVAADAATP
ncbi:MAG: hypothetical protein JNK72_14470 [Myxococcales bacterium]|nr:hypothetical protein [Myxococcales bacterium]